MEVVYGASLEALKLAAAKDAYIILDDATPPPPYTHRRANWAQLYVQLMLAGKVRGGDALAGCRVTEEELRVVSKPNIVMAFPYTKLYVLSDKKITGLPAPVRRNKKLQVVDYLEGVSLSVPHLNYIKTNDDFVSEIFIFKPSVRDKTLIYALSSLTVEQIEDFDYSNTMARFKCEAIFKENKFQGAANGKHKRLLKLESTGRDIHEPMHVYKDTEKIEFINGS
tara:strand:+ start:5791 stop:6462 length:672 start_codon:yes stop_codon:yes gene_type:complete